MLFSTRDCRNIMDKFNHYFLTRDYLRLNRWLKCTSHVTKIYTTHLRMHIVRINMLFTNSTLTFLFTIQSKTSQLRAMLLSRLRIRDKRGKVTHRKQINKGGKKNTHTDNKWNKLYHCKIYILVERESAFLLLIKRPRTETICMLSITVHRYGRSANVASVSIARPGYTSRLPRRQKGVLSLPRHRRTEKTEFLLRFPRALRRYCSGEAASPSKCACYVTGYWWKFSRLWRVTLLARLYTARKFAPCNGGGRAASIAVYRWRKRTLACFLPA